MHAEIILLFSPFFSPFSPFFPLFSPFFPLFPLFPPFSLFFLPFSALPPLSPPPKSETLTPFRMEVAGKSEQSEQLRTVTNNSEQAEDYA